MTQTLNLDEIRAMGIIPLMLKLGMLRQVNEGAAMPLYETNHLNPMSVASCRPKLGPRPFDRRIETVDKDGHVVTSSRWTRSPVGQRRQRNRARNRVAKAARRRNRK